MSKKLLIIFVKNIRLGKVKTRLAVTIGDDGAFEVYKHLVKVTEEESIKLKDIDRHIYFSDVIVEGKWPNDSKFVQKGNNLGEKMQDAFSRAFDLGYEEVVGIGSDLPEISTAIIELGFEVLKSENTVFGPALDGGYYLFGMSSYYPFIFENKPWSKENLLETTKTELSELNISYGFLGTRNDVDTIEDLKESSIAEKFKYLYDLP